MKITITIEGLEERETQGYDNTVTKELHFDSRADLEAFTIDPDKTVKELYDLHISGEEANIYDPVEDDGDTYNGETTNDQLA